MTFSKSSLQTAASFITLNGSTVEKARLHAILKSESITPEEVQSLLSGQRTDGGWAPFWAPGTSSLDATCYRLAQAEQLGISPAEPAIQRSVQFLASRQHPDGSFEESVPASSAPPWARPGDLAARLYLTANCGFWLAVLGGPPDSTRRAGDFLLDQVDSAGRLPSFLHTHWLAAGLLSILDLQTPASNLMSYLEQRLPDLSPSSLAWMITTLRLSGWSEEHPLLARAAVLLSRLQAPDGHWPSEDGEDRDVHATLEAVRAMLLRGFGRE